MKCLRVLFLIYVLCLFSCKTAKVKNEYDTSFIIMEKTACYGTCPVYKITLNGTGKALYEGKRYVDKIGKYEKQLSEQQTQKIFTAFDASNFTDFREEYTDEITDLSTTFLTFSHRGFSKRIKDYYNAPAELKKLEKMVEEVANSEGWSIVVSE